MADEDDAGHNMHAVLRPGGILVLTQGTTDKQWREKPQYLLAVNTAEVSRLFVIDLLEHGARYHIVDIFHSPALNDFQVWSVDYPLILLRDDYQRLLKEAGFNTVKCWGSYRFEPYDKETSTRLIIVAAK